MFPDQLRTGRFPAAIGLSLVAARLAVRLAKGALTYGFKRVEILSAQANGVTPLVLAASSPTRRSTGCLPRRTAAVRAGEEVVAESVEPGV